MIPGWWFGCHEFYFPINIGLLIIPMDFHIFQRGGPTTNQYLFIYLHVFIYILWESPFIQPQLTGCREAAQKSIPSFSRGIPRFISHCFVGTPATGQDSCSRSTCSPANAHLSSGSVVRRMWKPAYFTLKNNISLTTQMLHVWNIYLLLGHS